MPKDQPRRKPRLFAALAIAASCHAATLAAMPEPALAQPAAGAAAGTGKTSTSGLIQRGADLFDDQQYEESIQTLSAALLRPGTSKQDKIEIYRLLAYNYITLRRSDEADGAVRGLLVIDETYRLAPTESPRFREFFDATRQKWEQEGKPGKVDETKPVVVEKPVRITHSSPAQVEPDSTIRLTGSLDDPGARVRGVQLAYRTGAKGKYVTAAATYAAGQFRAQIPGTAVKPPLVEYYLQAIDKDGLPVALRGDADTPLRIAVPEKSGSVLTSPWFWIPVGLLVAGGAVATTLILTQQKTEPPGPAPRNTATISVRITE
jgi:hypothetical protein